MIAFDVYVNGEKRIRAGVGPKGVLSSILSWGSTDTSLSGRIDLEILGLANSSEHLSWLRETLSVGDRVTVEVVDATEVDEPVSREVTPRPNPPSSPNLEVVKK